MHKLIKLIFISLLPSIFAGCSAVSQPVRAQSSAGVNGLSETYLVAKPADLRLSIFGVKAGAQVFPYVLLMLRNTSKHAVIVAYADRAVTVHCGQYSQAGPAETDGVRRQIIEPGCFILLDPPEGGWKGATSEGQAELMIPVTLPPGDYLVSATLKLAGQIPGTIESDKRTYHAKDHLP